MEDSSGSQQWSECQARYEEVLRHLERLEDGGPDEGESTRLLLELGRLRRALDALPSSPGPSAAVSSATSHTPSPAPAISPPDRLAEVGQPWDTTDPRMSQHPESIRQATRALGPISDSHRIEPYLYWQAIERVAHKHQLDVPAVGEVLVSTLAQPPGDQAWAIASRARAHATMAELQADFMSHFVGANWHYKCLLRLCTMRQRRAEGIRGYMDRASAILAACDIDPYEEGKTRVTMRDLVGCLVRRGLSMEAQQQLREAEGTQPFANTAHLMQVAMSLESSAAGSSQSHTTSYSHSHHHSGHPPTSQAQSRLGPRVKPSPYCTFHGPGLHNSAQCPELQARNAKRRQEQSTRRYEETKRSREEDAASAGPRSPR